MSDVRMTTCFFRIGELHAANDIVTRYHYSHRPPANVQVVGTWHAQGGLFGDFGPCVAACFFSIPPTRWSEDVWELTRLVRTDDFKEPLSGLIANTCSHIKQTGKIDLLVSFADKTQGHHGGIYQACSWRYAGARERRMDGLIINGAFVPGRTCNSLYGTQSPSRLKTIYPAWFIDPHYDDGKHLYWRPLRRSGMVKANRLCLQSLDYPKPDATEPPNRTQP